MITRMTVTLTTKKAAKEFAAAVNEALEDEFASVEGDVIDIVWTEAADPTELLEALAEARESMDWDFE